LKKLFRLTLQNKLIAAFLFVGLVPMILSSLIVVSMNSRRLEKQIERDIKKASEETIKVIRDYQSRAEQIASFLIDNPRFTASARSGEAPQVIQTGRPLILWMEGKPPRDSYGKDIIQLEMPQALIAGTITPLDDEDGTHLGEVIVGYQLGKSFAQDMSLLTDVEVSIHYMAEDDRRDAYYEKNATFQGVEYEAYYQPLRNRDGRTVGRIFTGVPKRYGFMETVSTWRFFPILIGLCAIMAGSLGYTMARRISKPIRLFSKGVHDVAEGNLDQEISITSSEELAELSNAFNHMTEKLRELRQLEEELRRKDRLAALGELSAGVAHEIRNPLGIIRSSAQVLEKNVEELTSFIIGEVDRLNRVVSNFLDFAGPHDLDLEETQIEDVVEKSLHLAEPKLSLTHTEVAKDYDKNLPNVRIDPELISQAFLNLIINAAEAMADSGKLTIKARHTPNLRFRKGYVEVSFADTGTGIPKEMLTRFSPAKTRVRDSDLQSFTKLSKPTTGKSTWKVRLITEASLP
jgi:signal transduction histidine kinase